MGEFELIETAVDWVVAQVQDWGYWGITAMMFVESSFFPFPSEVAMVPAGMLAARGEMDPYLATLVGCSAAWAARFSTTCWRCGSAGRCSSASGATCF